MKLAFFFLFFDFSLIHDVISLICNTVRLLRTGYMDAPFCDKNVIGFLHSHLKVFEIGNYYKCVWQASTLQNFEFCFTDCTVFILVFTYLGTCHIVYVKNWEVSRCLIEFLGLLPILSGTRAWLGCYFSVFLMESCALFRNLLICCKTNVQVW